MISIISITLNEMIKQRAR